jgi:hypothetical protein
MARRSPRVSLLAVTTLAVIAFLIKEDGVMLLPTIVALTLAQSWLLEGQMPRRAGALLVAAIVIDAALIGLRQQRLGALGGYGLPHPDVAVRNFVKGLTATLFLWPTRRPWQELASAVAILTVGVTLACSGGGSYVVLVLGSVYSCPLP